MSPKMSDAARSARENARQKDGKFGLQHLQKSDVDLGDSYPGFHLDAVDEEMSWAATGPSLPPRPPVRPSFTFNVDAVDEEMSWAATGPSLPPRKLFTDAEVDEEEKYLQLMTRRIRYIGEKMGFNESVERNIDDLVALTYIELMKTRERSGISWKELYKKPTSYLRQVMRGVASKNMGRRYPRNVTGFNRLKLRQEQLEQKLGRILSEKEYDELAEKVRMEFPTKSRPSRDYHREVREQAILDATDEDHPSRQVPVHESGFDRVDDALSTTGVNRAEVIADRVAEEMAKGTINRATLSRRSWMTRTALVEAKEPWRRPIPYPKTSSLTDTQMRKVRGVVDAAGGAKVLAQAHLDGYDAHVLFTPFGDVDGEDKDAIADFLVEADDDDARELYASALKQAGARDSEEARAVDRIFARAAHM